MERYSSREAQANLGQNYYGPISHPIPHPLKGQPVQKHDPAKT